MQDIIQLIKPYYQIYGQTPASFEEALQWIEKAGRTCYKSEDKITENSAHSFVHNLIKCGHLSVIEHSNFVICERIASTNPRTHADYLKGVFGKRNTYHKIEIHHGKIYINGNIRAWYETLQNTEFLQKNGSLVTKHFNDLFSNAFPIFQMPKYGIDDSHNQFAAVTNLGKIPKSLRYYTVKIVCDRGITHEIVRHRPASYSQESTRYVNYKNRGLVFIIPHWINLEPCTIETRKFYPKNGVPNSEELWIMAMLQSEYLYNELIKHGWKAEQARSVLPNSLKAEIIVTADREEWKHIFKLRTSKRAHSQMREIMIPLEEELTKNPIWYYKYK